MKEYIERSAAIHAMNKANFERTCSMDNWDVIEQMKENVEILPAADVAPVVHGEWIAKIHNDGLGNYTLYHCSECDCKNAYKRNYCGYCGAKMDRGKING